MGGFDLFLTGYAASNFGVGDQPQPLSLNPYLCGTGTYRSKVNFQPFVSVCADADYVPASNEVARIGPDLFVTGAIGHMALQVGGGIGLAYDTGDKNMIFKQALVLSSVLPIPRTVQAGILIQNLGTDNLDPSALLFVGGNISDLVKEIF